MYESKGERRRAGAAVPGKATRVGSVTKSASNVPGKSTLVGATASMTLPAALRARLERALSTDLSAVRIGVDPRVAAMGARAVASGTTILFAPDAYDPGTASGEALIAHEVVHLVQQTDRSVTANAAVGGVAINHDPALEHEADDLGARALRGEIVRTGGSAPSPTNAAYQGFFGEIGDFFGELAETAGEKIDTAVDAVKTTVKTVLGGAAAATGTPGTGDPALIEDHTGSFGLQRILESDSFAVVAAAHDALIAAKRRRGETDDKDIIEFEADGTAYSIESSPSITDAMIAPMGARRDELAFTPIDPKWATFATAFNAHFKSVANSLDLGARNDTRKPEVIAARLMYLFTDTHRDKLTDYMETGMIPEQLFTDDVGHLTASQRIMIASKILADGKYKPGSVTQEVHARACFHWVHIVWQYAGVKSEAATTNYKVFGQFDLNGDLLLGDGGASSIFDRSASSTLEPTAAHLAKNPNAFRDKNAPWGLVQNLQPGDWLYIYTENASANGMHSVIFAGWEDKEDQRDPGTGHRYRNANMYDQGQPKFGGNHHTRFLGEDFFVLPSGKKVHPVGQIVRSKADSAPMTDAHELVDGKDRSGANGKFIAKKEKESGKTFDKSKLIDWLRDQNAGYIDELIKDSRLSDGQRDMFREANSSDVDSELIRLNQRLCVLAWNSDRLEDYTGEMFGEGLEKKQQEAEAKYLAAALPLKAEILVLETERLAIEGEAWPITIQLDALTNRVSIAELKEVRRKGRIEKDAMPGGAARKKKVAELHEINRTIKALTRAARPHVKEIAKLEKEYRPFAKLIKALDRKITRLEHDLADLGEPELFGFVHGLKVEGQGKKLPMTGLYADIPGTVPWDSFLE